MPKITKKGFNTYKSTILAEREKGSSLFNEVVSKEQFEKPYRVSNYLDLLEKWYNTKLEEANKTLQENKGNEEIEQECYGKIMAYSAIVMTDFYEKKSKYHSGRRQAEIAARRGELFEAKQSYKNLLNNKAYKQYGINEEMLYALSDYLKKPEEYHNNFISLNENGEIDHLLTSDEIITQEELKETKELLKKDRERRIKEREELENAKLELEKAKSREDKRKEKANEYYRNLNGKVEYVSDLYNNGINGNYSVNRGIVDLALGERERSENIFNSEAGKNLSILEKIEAFKKNNIEGYENSIALNSAPEFTEKMYTDMLNIAFDDNVNLYNEKGENSFNKKFKKESDFFKELNENLTASYQGLMVGKLALYAETKRALDKRSGISKFFHPTRTKQENAKLQEIKNDIKKTIGCDDSFFNKMDKLIKNPNAQVDFDNIEINFGNGKADYKEVVNQRYELFKGKQLQEELDLELSDKIINEKPVNDFANATMQENLEREV